MISFLPDRDALHFVQRAFSPYAKICTAFKPLCGPLLNDPTHRMRKPDAFSLFAGRHPDSFPF